MRLGLAALTAIAALTAGAAHAQPVRWAAPAAPDPHDAGAELRLPLARGSGKAPEGRWFAYVAARRQELGAQQGDPRVGGLAWQDDRASAAMTRAEAGLALRKGDAQATFGYVQRRFEVSGAQSDLLATMPKSDHLAGVSLSFSLH